MGAGSNPLSLSSLRSSVDNERKKLQSGLGAEAKKSAINLDFQGGDLETAINKLSPNMDQGPGSLDPSKIGSEQYMKRAFGGYGTLGDILTQDYSKGFTGKVNMSMDMGGMPSLGGGPSGSPSGSGNQAIPGGAAYNTSSSNIMSGIRERMGAMQGRGSTVLTKGSSRYSGKKKAGTK